MTEIVAKLKKFMVRHDLTAYRFCKEVLEGAMLQTQLRRWLRGEASPTGVCFGCKRTRQQQLEEAMRQFEAQEDKA